MSLQQKGYLVCIDESGDFEKYINEKVKDSRKPPIKLVGGTIVPESLLSRREEIKNKLIPIGKKYFPEMKNITGIHVSDQDLPDAQKKTLKKELMTFLLKEMPEMQFAFIYDTTNLDDDTATPGAQLFRYMLINLMNTIVYYHPEFNESDHFNVNLAHRRVHYPAAFDRKLSEQGYIKLRSDGNEVQYTAITKADIISIMRLHKNYLEFKSSRDALYDMKPYAQWDDPFMVMADFLCNHFFHLIIDNPTTDKLHMALMKGELKNNIFFYCSTDYEFPFSTLGDFHGGKIGSFIEKTVHRDFTSPVDDLLLGPAVEKASDKIKGLQNAEDCMSILKIADTLLKDRLYHRFNTVGRLGEMVKVVIEDTEKPVSGPDWDRVAYLCYDVLLRYSNHRGNNPSGIKYLKNVLDVFGRMTDIDIEISRTHHAVINRASVTLTNEFAFKRSNALVCEVKNKEETISSLFKGVKNVLLGAIYGSMAQNFAFMQNYTEADKYFNSAAEHFSKDHFTQASYRAHMWIDRNMKAEYTQELEYILAEPPLILNKFSGYEDSMKDILQDGFIDSISQFKILLLIKGVFAFGKNDEKRKLANITFTAIRDGLQEYKNHPWQLILINLGRLLSVTGQNAPALMCWNAAIDFPCNSEEITLYMFAHAARAEKAILSIHGGKLKEAQKIVADIIRHFNDLASAGPIGIYNPKKIKDSDGVERDGWFDEVVTNLIEVSENGSSNQLKEALNAFLSRFTFTYR